MLNKSSIAVLTSFAILLIETQGSANDGAFELGIGGLVPGKSSAVEMTKEVLTVSVDRIQVEYEFLNSSDKDVTHTVAFPIPDFCGFYIQLGHSIDKKNPVNFTLEVDGKKKDFSLDFKSTVKKEQEEDIPCYSIKYHWKQKFPAKKTVRVSHSYKPSVGYDQGHLGDYLQKKDIEKTYRQDFCIEEGLAKSLEKRFKSGKFYESGVSSKIQPLEYILTTANTWKGPIKDFTLILKKSTPNQIISLCWEGLKKIDSKTFEGKRSNFKPTKELKVLFFDE